MTLDPHVRSALPLRRRHRIVPPLRRGPLPEPSPADPRPRRLLDPRAGLLRRLERRASVALSQHVYPRLPGLRHLYELQLRHGLAVREAEIPLPGLSLPWEGTRILFVSDLHAGPFVSARALEQAVDRLLALEPDVILLGGDLVTCHLAEASSLEAALHRLRAPLGAFAVLGNHDHYTGESEALRRLVEASGVEVLHNRAVTLYRKGTPLTVAGVDDLLLGEPDLDAALADTSWGADRPLVLLSHNPDVFFDAAARGVPLVLSGHTHGGQIRIPGLPVLVRMSRYRLDDGRYRHRDSELIVSRGLGVVGLPFRLVCPPEAILLTLETSRA